MKVYGVGVSNYSGRGGEARRDEAKTSKRIACRCVYSRAAAVVANGIT